MFVRSILSSYYRLLAGLSLACWRIVLTGCNEVVARKRRRRARFLSLPCTTSRISGTQVFVGTIKPRIETDMGFRSRAKWQSAWSKSAKPSMSASPWRPSMKSI